MRVALISLSILLLELAGVGFSLISTRKVPSRSDAKMIDIKGDAGALGAAGSPNIELAEIKNCRDISTALGSGILGKSKVLRTGCVSKANQNDITKICEEEVGVNVFVDLRSKKELEKDMMLFSTDGIYGDGCADYIYDKKTKDFKALNQQIEQQQEQESAKYTGTDYIYDTQSKTFSIKFHEKQEQENTLRKRRYFVSLLSEGVIRKGVFLRFFREERTSVKLISLFLLSLVSSRAYNNVRARFVDRINRADEDGGGLLLLNQIMVEHSKAKIAAVLRVLTKEIQSQSKGNACAIYCTAGKDRTGLVSMLLLSILGATDEEIVADYVHSDTAYSDEADRTAMVAAMANEDIDPEIFLRARPFVIESTMRYIRERHGSIDDFLDECGFDQSWREKLRSSMVQ